MAFRAPLLGYNTNVRHAGKLYHIQTEDSGVDHPHIITHLFADGGRIVASKKTSYAERVGSEGLQDTVKKLMQAQHKAMFIALRDGVYDEDTSEDTEEQTGPRKLPKELQQAIAAEARTDAHADATTDGSPASEAVALDAQAAQEPITGQVAVKRPAASSAVFKAPKSDLAESVALEAKDTVVTKTPNAPRSLFGAELLSDTSLDEVILNYLAANEKDG